MKREEVDVLVVGSGAGGLASAVSAAHRGLKVIVAEKEPVFGGTTARSGGWSWIQTTVRQNVQASRTALKKHAPICSTKRVSISMLPVLMHFLRLAQRPLNFLKITHRCNSTWAPHLPTTIQPRPAAWMQGVPSSRARLMAVNGKEIKRLTSPLWEITVLGMMIGSGKELLHFFNVTRSPVSAFYVTGLVAKFVRDVVFHGRAMRLMNGNALIARLAKSAFEKNVPIWTTSPVKSLIRNDDEDVIGAIINRPDGPVEVIARKGVVLAAGGFPQDPVRRKELMPHAPSGHEHVSPAPPGNTGDGLRLGESVGGQVNTDLPHSAAWVPISRPPRGDGTLGTFPHFVDRSKPGVIAVTRSGRRL